MSEGTLALIAFLKFIWISFFAFFYSLGGTAGYGKWLRRFCGSAWIGIGVYGFSAWTNSFHWWYLFYPILLMGGLHLGYGADEIFRKIIRRAIYGIALGIAAIPLVFGSGLWMLFYCHVVLCVATSVVLGVFNPTKSARDEESLIAGLSTIVPLFLI